MPLHTHQDDYSLKKLKINFGEDMEKMKPSFVFFFFYSVTKSYSTLWEAMDCSLPGSSVHGVFQGRILKQAAIPFSGDFPDPGTESICLLNRLHQQTDSLPLNPHTLLVFYQNYKMVKPLQETVEWFLKKQNYYKIQ